MSAMKAILRGASRVLVLDPRQNLGHGSRGWDEGYAFTEGRKWDDPVRKAEAIMDSVADTIRQIAQEQAQEAPGMPDLIPVPTDCLMSAQGHPCTRTTPGHRMHKCLCGERVWAQ